MLISFKIKGPKFILFAFNKHYLGEESPAERDRRRERDRYRSDRDRGSSSRWLILFHASSLTKTELIWLIAKLWRETKSSVPLANAPKNTRMSRHGFSNSSSTIDIEWEDVSIVTKSCCIIINLNIIFRFWKSQSIHSGNTILWQMMDFRKQWIRIGLIHWWKLSQNNLDSHNTHHTWTHIISQTTRTQTMLSLLLTLYYCWENDKQCWSSNNSINHSMRSFCIIRSK